ncbi:MAG: hypothetical protein L6R38_004467 [Xanthoria sp. 2 TBL-2021]|nr:MAG: hypothetical protein L6R38_004467 [Xanthoria sp. 2 TBL-2021]
MAEPKLLSTQQIAEHNTAKDLWIVVDGQVWDMTDFAPEHPGGIGIILQYAGRDASQPYNEIHAPSLLNKTLTSSKLVGTLDTSTISDSWAKPPPQQNPKVQLKNEKPPLFTLLSTHDFESVAEKTLAPKTWAFYSSAATDLVTHKANQSFFDRIWFRPRVLRNIRTRDTRWQIMGQNVELPIMCSPAAMAKLVHPDGEKAIARGCQSKGVIQCVSTNASFPIEDIASSLPPSQSGPPPLFFQLYVSKTRTASEALLRQVWSLGIRTIFLTVDSPLAGKREADERVRMDDDQQGIPMMTGVGKPVNDKRGGGLGRITGSFIDEGLDWSDLPWLRQHWKGKIVLKGIMCAEDASRAAKEGLDGIVVSNHGGRNLDTSPPAILILLDLHRNAPHVFDKLEVYVDGGIRRGTDILKAICLGATAVSLGRPFLYSLNYGPEGVEYLIDMLKDELSVAMALVGITSLDQAHPGLVNTNDVDYLVPTTEGHPYAKKRKQPLKAKM